MPTPSPSVRLTADRNAPGQYVMTTARSLVPPLPPGPDYETVPLGHDEVRVAAVQMNPVPVDAADPATGIASNLEHMLELCESAACWPPDGDGVQLVCFPEFTLTGFDTQWTREQWLNIAIRVPGGPEIERIGAKAKDLGTYIAFASHTQDPDSWPGHFFNNSVIVSPAGEVVHTHWKAYLGFPGCAEYSTCAHDVLDEFLERYGPQALWPVCRTEIGNIGTSVCSEGFVPETARALAMSGTEIFVRHVANGARDYTYEVPTVGNGWIRTRSDCMSNHMWGVYVDSRGNQLTVGSARISEGGMGGGTMLADPFGRVLQQAADTAEHILHTTIPIAAHRRKHRIPRVRQELYAPVYAATPGPPPNLYAQYLPSDRQDALRWSGEHLAPPATEETPAP